MIDSVNCLKIDQITQKNTKKLGKKPLNILKVAIFSLLLIYPTQNPYFLSFGRFFPLVSILANRWR